MVSTRKLIAPTRKTSEVALRSRLYSSVSDKPISVIVLARQDKTFRYPFAESVLDGAKTQPYVHDCLLRAYEGPHLYSFRAFFKRHCLLPPNSSVNALNDAIFRGDIVVMKIGKRLDYVNMSGRDVLVADWVTSRLAFVMSQKARGRFPRELVFHREM